MKKLILLLFLSLCFTSRQAEEEEQPLPDFFKCNSSGHQYCRSARHAAIVDAKIKIYYKKGIRITPELIRQLSIRYQPTNANNNNPGRP
ncbi:MAG: hypothetical protein QNL04_10700 [SAR324 cluster bacterium]|nr:hypothetical protein [SAR324 cluster bacterium]